MTAAPNPYLITYSIVGAELAKAENVGSPIVVTLATWLALLRSVQDSFTKIDVSVSWTEVKQTNLGVCSAAVALLAEQERINPSAFGRDLKDALADTRLDTSTHALKVKKLIDQFGKSIVEQAWSAHTESIQTAVRINSEGRILNEQRRRQEILLALDQVASRVRQLDSQLPFKASRLTGQLWEAAAIMAELAYFKVLEKEIDEYRRGVKVLIPSFAFNSLVERGLTLDTAGADGAFYAATEKTVAVGVRQRGRIYIGLRGTIFAYLGDWRVNFNVFGSRFKGMNDYTGGRYHKGFFDEAKRITDLVWAELDRLHARDCEIVLSGHSLGGAVASISQVIMLARGIPQVYTISFGSPRYCNREAYNLRISSANVVQIVRDGDMVPTVPPRWLGYADPNTRYLANGNEAAATGNANLMLLLRKWPVFVGSRFAPHAMERYLRDVGDPTTIMNLFGTMDDIRASDFAQWW